MTARATLATAQRVLRAASARPAHLRARLLVVPAPDHALPLRLRRAAAMFDHVGGADGRYLPVHRRCSSSPRSRCCANARSGTLERLMSLPLAKLDLLRRLRARFRGCGGRAGVDHRRGGLWPARARCGRPGVARRSCSLSRTRCSGCRSGLFVSAFARTEFQAVQFMPAVVFPQLLLCGLIQPREHMQHVLRAVSYALPHDMGL